MQVPYLEVVHSLTETERLIAFARVLTDRIFKAFIFDVIVDAAYRNAGLGIGKWELGNRKWKMGGYLVAPYGRSHVIALPKPANTKTNERSANQRC